jgi:hypothetical protein
MTRRITPQTSLDNLKKEAKRWLKELRSNNPDARARFERAMTKAPANPGLRDVQRALAAEYGFPGWTGLKKAIEVQDRRPGKIQPDRRVRPQLPQQSGLACLPRAENQMHYGAANFFFQPVSTHRQNIKRTL